ncbi:MAG: RNA polymerase sigma factor, partial [Myxococcales bacterium]|nr:RNA polymerase sigma factor [Myxococcales bacterium]
MNQEIDHRRLGRRPGWAPRDAKPRRLPGRFTSLYRSHYDFVWRCGLRLGVHPREIDDVVQETFLVALRRLDDFDTEGSAQPSTWLFGILRNVVRNHKRGDARRERKLGALSEMREHLGSDKASEHAATEALGWSLLDDFLATLDDERRAIYVLAELEGASSQEIGSTLGLNANTARSRLRAVRAAFTRHFEDPEHAEVVRAAASAPPQPDPEQRKATLQAIAAVELAGAGLAGGGAVSTLGFTAWLGKGAAILLLGAGLVVGVAQA